MKRKYQYLFCFFLLCFLYGGIFLEPQEVIRACQTALTIFADKLFPSIFPFFLLSFLLYELGFTDYFKRLFAPIMRYLFHLSGDASFALIMSIISGFPSGGKYVAMLYEEKKISKNEANYLLLFTHFANPLFVLGTCGGLLHNLHLAYRIFILQIVANIMIAFFLRPKEIPTKESLKKTTLPHKSLLQVLPNAINQAMEVLLFMLGSITVFQFFSTLICHFVPLNSFFEVLVTGLLDLTSGIASVPSLTLSPTSSAMLMLAFITFGSFSVHIQVINAIKKLDLSYGYFFLGRVIETALALSLFLLF